MSTNIKVLISSIIVGLAHATYVYMQPICVGGFECLGSLNPILFGVIVFPIIFGILGFLLTNLDTSWGKRFKFPYKFFIYSPQIFSERNGSESRPHSSPNPSWGRKISRGKAENPFSPKNSFPLCRVRIEAPRTARILGGQNPERKTPFPFSRKNSPPPNQESKECFFFRGCWRTRQCVGLSSSVQFSFASPRTQSVRSHYFTLFWK